MSLALVGKTVVVTRPAHQSEELVEQLQRAGAEVLRLPMIAIEDPTDNGLALRSALDHLADYEWVVFTSANAVERFFDALGDRSLPSVKVACVGSATASAVNSRGVRVDLVPDDHVSEALVEAFAVAVSDASVLLPSAAVTRDVVAPGLRAKGWKVDVVEAYRTEPCSVTAHEVASALAADVITFTSPSTVDQFIKSVGRPHDLQVIASIGPVTTARLNELGLSAMQAEPHTVRGLVSALTQHFD